MAYHGSIQLQENIIYICEGYSAHVAGWTNASHETGNIINSLYSSIINYKVVQKPISIENYVKSNNNWEVDKLFYTNWRY